jgi:hypothetical protein
MKDGGKTPWRNPANVRTRLLSMSSIISFAIRIRQQRKRRSIGEGFPPDEVRRLIGCVVASEIFGILKNQEPYDEERYVAALKKLPELWQ